MSQTSNSPLQFPQSDQANLGRPPKLTAELIEHICDFISSSQSISAISRLVQISESTFYRWLSKAKQPGAEQVYVDFAARVEEAVQFSEVEALQRIRYASRRDEHWRAAAWILERRFPEKYGRRAILQYPEELKIQNTEETKLTEVA